MSLNKDNRNHNNLQKEKLSKERESVLQQWEDWFDIPMLILGLLWLTLLIIDLVWKLSPFMSVLIDVIWVIFIIDFILRFILSPHKLIYLRNNIIVLISLALPVFRVFRIAATLRLFQTIRLTRGLRLLRIFASINRGMGSISRSFGKKGFGYVISATILVTITGGAGIYYFEKQNMDNFGSALWWAAMIMTTLGSAYWPITPEGRIICLFLSLFAISVLGYITAILTSLFIGVEKIDDKNERLLKKEIMILRREISEIKEMFNQKNEDNK